MRTERKRVNGRQLLTCFPQVHRLHYYRTRHGLGLCADYLTLPLNTPGDWIGNRPLSFEKHEQTLLSHHLHDDYLISHECSAFTPAHLHIAIERDTVTCNRKPSQLNRVLSSRPHFMPQLFIFAAIVKIEDRLAYASRWRLQSISMRCFD